MPKSRARSSLRWQAMMCLTPTHWHGFPATPLRWCTLLLTFLINPLVIHGDVGNPRVAILFITRGAMPLEGVWTDFLKGCGGLRPPQFSAAQRYEVMETSRVAEVQKRLVRAGRLRASNRLHKATCASNAVMRVRGSARVQQRQAIQTAPWAEGTFRSRNGVRRFHPCSIHPGLESEGCCIPGVLYPKLAWHACGCDTCLKAAAAPHQCCTHPYRSTSPDMQDTAADVSESWQPQIGPLHSRRRGARLKDPSAIPHPIYAAQTLFSTYVHTDPSFDGFSSSSIFYGREIVPQVKGERFSHALTRKELILFEAALTDPDVDNAHFVVASEAGVPLYHGAIIYWQLLNERRSRVGKPAAYQDLIKQDRVRPP
jgi:hypothetical protein